MAPACVKRYVKRQENAAPTRRRSTPSWRHGPRICCAAQHTPHLTMWQVVAFPGAGGGLRSSCLAAALICGAAQKSVEARHGNECGAETALLPASLDALARHLA